MSWNSIIVPYDSNRKIAAKTLVNQRGDTISIFSGSFLLQSVICDIKKDIDKVAILVSNVLTHYEIDNSTKAVLKEYSPLKCFELKGKAGETKVFDISDPICVKFCEIDEISFQLMELSKEKIILDFKVHLYYRLHN